MARVKEAKGRTAKSRTLKGRRAAGKGRSAICIPGEIPRVSAQEIQRKLVESMIGVLEGRLDTEEALAISMVAEEQIKMLDEEEAAKSPKVEGWNGESKSQTVEKTKGPLGEEAERQNVQESKEAATGNEKRKGKERFGRWVN